MARQRLQIFQTADEIGTWLGTRLLSEIEQARVGGRRYVIGCPTGRTPRPIYQAIATRLAESPQDLSHVVLAMMDEYLVRLGQGLEYAPRDNPWSCHYFAQHEIIDRWNASLPDKYKLPDSSIWFPDPRKPDSYDGQIANGGGIDFFILASGASDGHVAFNPPGSRRDTRTRVIALSDQTRRDNLQTFPSFGTIDAVPKHGVSVGIATIITARAAAMVLTGPSKQDSLSRILKAEHYDPQWPATIIHEFDGGEILADREAAAGLG